MDTTDPDSVCAAMNRPTAWAVASFDVDSFAARLKAAGGSVGLNADGSAVVITVPAGYPDLVEEARVLQSIRDEPMDPEVWSATERRAKAARDAE